LEIDALLSHARGQPMMLIQADACGKGKVGAYANEHAAPVAIVQVLRSRGQPHGLYRARRTVCGTADRLVVITGLNDQNVSGSLRFLEQAGIQPKSRSEKDPLWDDADTVRAPILPSA